MLAWLLRGALTLTLLALCALPAVRAAVRSSGPRASAEAFLANVRARNHAEAVRRTIGELRYGEDAARLEQAVGRLPALAEHTQVRWTGSTVGDETALLDGALVLPQGEAPVGIELRLRAGHWYVEHLVVQGHPLE